MNNNEVKQILENTDYLTEEEKDIIKNSYPEIRKQFNLNGGKKKEIEFLSSFIAFVKIQSMTYCS